MLPVTLVHYQHPSLYRNYILTPLWRIWFILLRRGLPTGTMLPTGTSSFSTPCLLRQRHLKRFHQGHTVQLVFSGEPFHVDKILPSPDFFALFILDPNDLISQGWWEKRKPCFHWIWLGEDVVESGKESNFSTTWQACPATHRTLTEDFPCWFLNAT